MSIDKGSPIEALTVYQTSLEDELDINLCDNTSDRGPKPIEKLVKLQLEPKPEQCRDLTNLEHRRIVDVLHKNVDLFAWQPSDMPGIHPNIIYHKVAICPQAKLVS